MSLHSPNLLCLVAIKKEVKSMKRISIIAVIGICMCMSSVTWSYDAEQAKSYAELFSTVVGAEAGKALHLMAPDTFVENIKDRKEFLVIDVRTPVETGIFGMALTNTLAIPVDQLFQPANLDRIPTDKPIIIMCQSGIRSVAVGTALRNIGFDDVYILKGGFKALSSYLGPIQAYQ